LAFYSHTPDVTLNTLCITVRLLQQMPVISFHRINRLFFVTEAPCVLCDVGTQFFITINFQNLLVAGPSPRRPGFYPMPVCVRYMVNKMALNGVSVEFSVFTRSVLFHHCSILIFILILLLLEGYGRQIGEISNKAATFREIREFCGGKY